MMTMLDDLIRMLREAPDGVRELDERIAEHRGWRWRQGIVEGEPFFVNPSGVEVEGGPPAWTRYAELAAQLWPRGWLVNLVYEPTRGDGPLTEPFRSMVAAQAWSRRGDAVLPHETFAATPALAHCVGALRAMQAEIARREASQGRGDGAPRVGDTRIQSAGPVTRVEFWTGADWAAVAGLQRATWTGGVDGPPRCLLEISAARVQADLAAAAGESTVRVKDQERAA